MEQYIREPQPEA